MDAHIQDSPLYHSMKNCIPHRHRRQRCCSVRASRLICFRATWEDKLHGMPAPRPHLGARRVQVLHRPRQAQHPAQRRLAAVQRQLRVLPLQRHHAVQGALLQWAIGTADTVLLSVHGRVGCVAVWGSATAAPPGVPSCSGWWRQQDEISDAWLRCVHGPVLCTAPLCCGSCAPGSRGIHTAIWCQQHAHCQRS